MATASAESSFETPSYACAVETFVLGASEQRHALCCCYELDEAERSRSGSVSWLSLDADDASWRTRQSLSFSSGITDAKFAGKPPILGAGEELLAAICKSTGSAALLRVRETDEGSAGMEVAAETDAGDSCLYLSCDWDNRASQVMLGATLAVSKSNGQVSTFQLGDGDEIRLSRTWDAHDFMGQPAETWIVACDQHGGSRLASGADDSKLKLWDLRSEAVVAQTKRHEAGVTAAQWHPEREHVLASGSYDQTVRVWDVRQMRREVDCVETPGGVWRVKWQPSDECPDLLLAACMHGGAAVLSAGQEDAGGSVRGLFTGHESMAYGVDWISCAPGSVRVASCSFYDRRLCAWKLDWHGRPS